MAKTAKKLSKGEEAFAFQCTVMRFIAPEREYKFVEGRKWRFDFAWPQFKLAVEIEGGTWSGGRHTRGSGFESDCSKYNSAAIQGWTVLRYTTEMVTAGHAIADVETIMNRGKNV